jgi:hypothetical protein
MIKHATLFGAFRKLRRATLVAVAIATASSAAQAMDAGYCQTYSRAAVKEFYRAHSPACGGQSGPRWHDNFEVHYNWRLASSYEDTQSEWNARRALLQSCAYSAQGRPVAGSSWQAGRPSWQAAPGENRCCPNAMLVCPLGRHWC